MSFYNEMFFESKVTFPTADSFTIKTFSESTFSGTVEQSDYQLDLNIKEIPIFHTADDYVYLLFPSYNYDSTEINYERFGIVVIPEGKTIEDSVQLLFDLEK